MQVVADRVSIEGPHGTLLPQTSLTVAGGELAALHGEPGPGLTAFGLALAGRLRPATGTITVTTGDGDGDSGGEARLRALTAVVDSPGVSEPDEALPLRVVVGEELALAGRPAHRAAVERWLADHDCAAYAGTRFENLGAEQRTRLLTELAASRDGVTLLVLDRPDRHTSEVDGWWLLAHEHAERGMAVVVLTATTPIPALLAAPARVGRLDQPDPVRCLPEEALS